MSEDNFIAIGNEELDGQPQIHSGDAMINKESGELGVVVTHVSDTGGMTMQVVHDESGSTYLVGINGTFVPGSAWELDNG